MHASCLFGSAVLFAASCLAAGDNVAPARQPEWTITEQGPLTTAENETLRVRFAYGARGAEGWFKGGGGEDGGIIELYYKPTSPTRNLIPRNGQWGGKKDALDFWELEPAAQNGADHNAPQFSTSSDAVLLNHRLRESAGRLISECDIQLYTFRIKRTHIVYPWGDITIHARLEHVVPARWNYIGHRIDFAPKPYQLQNGKQTLDWGGLYQVDGEIYYAWSDLYGPGGKYRNDTPYVYQDVIVDNLNKNTAISMAGRQDPYSGFMLDDRNGNDPDIVVMNGDPATWLSPFDQIARKVGGHSYVETGIYTPFYAKAKHIEASCCWFYATIPDSPPVYNKPMLWPDNLGPWEESFHILLRRGIEVADYLPLWRTRARELKEQAPTNVRGAIARLDNVDRLYHFAAEPGAKDIQFQWQRASAAPRAIDYRTAFVVEGLSVAEASIAGDTNLTVRVYQGGGDDNNALLEVVGPQSAEPRKLTIRVSR